MGKILPLKGKVEEERQKNTLDPELRELYLDEKNAAPDSGTAFPFLS